MLKTHYSHLTTFLLKVTKKICTLNQFKRQLNNSPKDIMVLYLFMDNLGQARLIQCWDQKKLLN